jgi:hypothetical protein
MNQLSQYLVEELLRESEKITDYVVVYSGRFQPFHKGHYATYQHLVKKFGKNNVFIGTSDKTDNQKSPFNFKEKKTIMTKMFGIPSNKIVQVKNPYAPMEILKNYDEITTALITVVGEKDEQRLGGKYFTPYKGDFEAGYKDKGYVYASPAQPNPISGTDVRKWLGSGESEERKKLFNKVYPKFDEKIFDLITKKLDTLNEDIIIETSSVGFGADDGEPETGYVSDGQKRVLNGGKPEPWFKQGGYKQMEVPKGDYMRGKGKTTDKDSQFRKVYYKIKNVEVSTLKTAEKPEGVDKWKEIKPKKKNIIKKDKRYWEMNESQNEIISNNEINQIADEMIEALGLAMGYPSKEQLAKKQKERDVLRKKMDSQDNYYEKVNENINIPVKVGDTILMGRFKNKKVVVKNIGKDDYGMPTINGKKVVTFRIVKEGIEVFFENDTEDSKYTHIGYGRYKQKGKEDDKSAPTFQKNDGGKYVQLSKGGEQPKSEPNKGTAVKGAQMFKHAPDVKQQTKPKSDTPKVSIDNVTKVLPNASKETFNSQSDINKIPDNTKRKISMQIDKLAELTKQAKEKGEAAPNYNLCKITVPNTNLYCSGNAGIPREEMPQFKGKPTPGSPASKMKTDASGEVDTEPMFKKMLKEKGIKTIETEIPSDSLKATQSELVGSKVAGMAKALEKDPNHPAITAPIYVSRDGYVVDGHHRWAAVTSNAVRDGRPANMRVIVIDMDIKDVIPLSNKFAEEIGVAAKKAATTPNESKINEIPMGDLEKIDTYADKQLNPMDVVITDKHFFDRLTDPRNKKPISAAELTGFFKRLGKHRTKFIEFLKQYGELVAKDKRTNINIPFMQKANKLIAKTIMRNDDYKTSNPIYKFESDKADVITISKSLGVNRAQMPQINSKDIKDYLEFLKEVGIRVSAKTINVSKVGMTQKEINIDKVKGLLGTEKSNLAKPVIISNDGYILDGHHRVVALYNIDKNFKLKTIEVDLGIKDLLKVTKEYPKVSYKGINEYVRFNTLHTLPAVNHRGLGMNDDDLDRLEKNTNVEESFTKGQIFAGKMKVGGKPVNVEVELVGADNKTKEFITRIIYADKGYERQLPIGSTLPIPARIFRTPGGGWRKIKTPSVFESILTEGGAYGHMAHPFDVQMNLTFGDLKNIVKKALTGDLEVAREKTDGQALAISWVNGRLVAARNKSHLKNKGAEAMTIGQVADKFGGRGGLTDAYNFAMQDLSKAIAALSEPQRKKIFKDGACFMNLEVIYPTSVNVIPYNQPLLVFHGTMEYNDEGIAIGEDQQAAKILAGMIKQVNQQVQSKYTIQGPPMQKLPKNEDLSKLQPKYMGMISKLQNEFGLSDNQGVAEYHQAWWTDFVNKNAKSLDAQQKIALVKRWAFYDKSFRINTIQDLKIRAWADGIDKKDHSKIAKDNLMRFEEIFLGVGADVLSFMKSVLTANPAEATKQMVDRLKKTIDDVNKLGDPKKIEKLKLELQRLQALGGFNKIVPNEGIVFVYNGSTYKLTGAFAPLNQILGLFYEK